MEMVTKRKNGDLDQSCIYLFVTVIPNTMPNFRLESGYQSYLCNVIYRPSHLAIFKTDSEFELTI